MKSITKILVLLIISLSNVSLFAQDDKTVTLVVSGSGKTQDEAKQNALRNAIEQAFGTFISSKTELLNDSLVKDEIVSVASGNIQKYEIISEVQVPNGDFATSLKATVSVTKLTSFFENKGVIVEFKGGLFTANMKQKMLNESSELKAVINLCNISWDLLSKSIDFKLTLGESPHLIDPVNQEYCISMLINATSNNNKNLFYNYFKKTLAQLSLSKSEIETYKAANIPNYTFSFKENGKEYPIYLRNTNSITAIKNLIILSNKKYFDFIISTGMENRELLPSSLENPHFIVQPWDYTEIDTRKRLLNKFCLGINGFIRNHENGDDPRLRLPQDALISISQAQDNGYYGGKNPNCSVPSPIRLFKKIFQAPEFNRLQENLWDNELFAIMYLDRKDFNWLLDNNCSDLVIEEYSISELNIFYEMSLKLEELNKITEVKIIPKNN